MYLDHIPNMVRGTWAHLSYAQDELCSDYFLSVIRPPVYPGINTFKW